MLRKDISSNLIHFISGKDFDEAYNKLKKILNDSYLIGSCEKIKCGYKCVCFTEAPLGSLENGLVNFVDYSRYFPFGIIFQKSYIFGKGGRPVIYQSDEEFEQLPEQLRWRHVRYEPNNNVDFTWEREWRIQCDKLDIHHDFAGIVVPNKDYAERIISEYDFNQNCKVLQYLTIMDGNIAELYREKFKWNIYWLNEFNK